MSHSRSITRLAAAALLLGVCATSADASLLLTSDLNAKRYSVSEMSANTEDPSDQAQNDSTPKGVWDDANVPASSTTGTSHGVDLGSTPAVVSLVAPVQTSLDGRWITPVEVLFRVKNGTSKLFRPPRFTT